jgi:xylulokinase
MTAPLLCGIDIGTTNLKAIVFDASGTVIAAASSPTPIHYPGPDRAEHDPEALWLATARTVRAALARLPDPAAVISVSVASMGESGVLVDGAGKAQGPMLAWFDGRTAPEARALAERIGGDQLFAESGLSLQRIFSLCKLRWLQTHHSHFFRSGVRWLNTGDWITYRLSGQQATDFSLASRTLLLKIHQLRWNLELLQELGFPPDLLAPLRPSGAHLGPITAEAAGLTGLPLHTAVAVGGHDHVCAALALGVTEPGHLLNSLGTAEALFLPPERPLTDPVMGRQNYTQGCHVAGGYYTFGGQYTLGASIDWFRHAVGNDAPYDILIAEAEAAPPGSLGVHFLPHLRLANPPHDDPRARGAFVGLTTDADRGVLFRALLEGLAYESQNTLEPLLHHTGLPGIRSALATGGASRNQLYMQLRATLLQAPMDIVSVDEATALGAALLGGVGAGLFTGPAAAAAAVRYQCVTVEPDQTLAPFYRRRFEEIFQPLYATLRTLNHRLAALSGAGEPGRDPS